MNKHNFSIITKDRGDCWSAICPELEVSGIGNTKEKAISSCVISIRTTLSALVCMLKKNPNDIDQFVNLK